MPGKNVAEEMYAFQDKYGFSERFEELEEKGRATAAPFEALDSYLWTSDGISYESRQYLHGLTYMLNKYVDNKLTPEYDSQKRYSLGYHSEKARNQKSQHPPHALRRYRG